MNRYIIVGGGISGLSAAYYARKNDPDAQITLLEAGDRWGGKISTDRVPFDHGQFIIEGGPDTFLATKPWGTGLCKELGLTERLHGTNQEHKNTYVLHNDRLLPLPDGLAMMIPTNIQAILKSRLISLPGKARMGMDFLIPPRPNQGDESLGSFVSRRLGREAYENLIEPLMSGIYAGDGDRLSLAGTFPYLRDLELKYGSLARGALHMRRKMPSSPGSRSAFLTPTTGLMEIVEALVHQLEGVDLRLNTRVTGITQWGSKFNVGIAGGKNLEAENIILATPAGTSGALLGAIHQTLAEDLRSIPHASTSTITLAYRQEDLPRPLDGYGYVIPRQEGRHALACTWTSTKFPHRAPQGFALIRVFVGRAGQEIHWDETSLLAIAREELLLTLGIHAEPLLTRTFIWEDAMPQYNLGHPQLVQRIESTLMKIPGLSLAGNGYRGIGIPDCIHSGELAVQKILSDRRVGNADVFPTHLREEIPESRERV